VYGFFCARPGVDPGGFEAGVAEELGDDNEVCAARSRERRRRSTNGLGRALSNIA
jgi:hypothetical protein